MANLFRLWRTGRHLKLIQITNRVYRRFIKVKPSMAEAPALRCDITVKAPFISRQRSISPGNTFVFLNVKRGLNFPGGWNDETVPKLWLYNLHYFEGLMNVDTPEELKENYIEQWITDNPVGYGNGWEPYPNSIRICNWIKWQLKTGALSPKAIHSLAVQTRYLTKTLEYHLLGNHLFANAKALIFAGIFFQGKESENWLRKGLKIFEEQLEIQFLEDGAHFELSTTYHTLLTEDLLDVYQLLQVTNHKVHELESVILRALNWLKTMTFPNGKLPLFNDAAYGVTPSTAEILNYASNLGVATAELKKKEVVDLAESGYFRYDGDNYSIICDAGQVGPSYLPGHAHCDMLSFELFAHGQPIIVDTGTSTYEEGERRQYERSTKAHNTVQVDEQEQSEIWGAFRVGRRAQIIQRNLTGSSAIITHNGFNVPCTREYTFHDNYININDEVRNCSALQVATARFHFHPEVCVSIKGGEVIAGPIRVQFKNYISIMKFTSAYALAFNKLIPNTVVEIKFKRCLQTKIFI